MLYFCLILAEAGILISSDMNCFEAASEGARRRRGTSGVRWARIPQ